jgi:uncharacterized protein YdeI (YjbR/CyaY-like superfamily)
LKTLKTFDPRTLVRWRKWLADHHQTEPEVWLIFHKQHTGKPSVPYLDALNEALCHGWIDSLVKRLDDERYARKFTPRKPGSKWSAINRRRYAELENAGRVKAGGKARSPAQGGSYDSITRVPETLPSWIAKGLRAAPEAWSFFKTLTPREQRMYLGWIWLAKREETKQRRMRAAIRLLSSRKKLGLK